MKRRHIALLALTLCLLLLTRTGLSWYVKPSYRAATPLVTTAGLVGDGFQITPLHQWIDKQQAQVVMLYYFAPNCGHCIQVGPSIAQLARTLSGQGIPTLGIASGRSTLMEVKGYVDRFQIPFEVLRDTSTAFARDNLIKGTPTLYLVPRQGNPEVYTGLTPGMETFLALQAVKLAGGPALSLLKPDVYVGSRACAACHAEEHRSWSLTHHGVALFSLKDEKSLSDPKCVSCHVTGWGKPTGYVDLEKTPELIHVGCEQCHGPAGGHGKPRAYVEEPKAFYGPTCLGCHDKKHSIGFSVEKGLPLVGHSRNRTVSDVEWLPQRQALEKGMGERPLIAFADGKVVGNAACKECHAAEYTQWEGTRHARAHQTLVAQGKQGEKECISCHALLTDPARRDDPAAWTPGVGCESCHGPGEAHVKARGGKDNIVGLTESCPVCVIESLCTSCHNTTNDADFDLEKDLPKAGHGLHPRQPAPPTN